METSVLNVQQMRALIAVMEIGTVTGAAAAIGRTQPQVSRLISNLEDEIGFPLFVRERRRLVATQRGARFYDEVKNALDGLDNIKRVAEQIRNDTEGVLRILAPPYVAHTVLPRALAAFRERYPDRRTVVEIVMRNAIGSWIAFHPFDVGIASLPFEIPAFKVKRFASVESVVVLPKGHPLAVRRTIQPADLDGVPFVAMHRNTPMRRRLDGIFEREGITLNIVGETTTSVSACEMAAQGLGVTIIDAVVPMCTNQALIEYRSWKPGFASEYGLIYPAAASISKAASDFSSIITETLLVPGSRHIRPVR